MTIGDFTVAPKAEFDRIGIQNGNNDSISQHIDYQYRDVMRSRFLNMIPSRELGKDLHRLYAEYAGKR